jgi:hypothetical protein
MDSLGWELADGLGWELVKDHSLRELALGLGLGLKFIEPECSRDNI